MSRFESLEHLNAVQVERLAQGRGVFTSRPYLLFMETMRGDKGVWYAACHRLADDALVGVCPVYDGGASSTSYWHPNRHFLSRAAQADPDPVWDPCRFVGIRSGYGWSPMVDPTLDPRTAAAVLGALLDAVREGPTAAMFLSDGGRDALLSLGLTDDDFFLAGATSVVKLSGRSFEEYLCDLPRYGQNARREMATFSRSGATVDVMDVGAAATEIAPQFVQLAEKYGLSTSADDEVAEMNRLGELMGSAARAGVLRREGQTVGGVVFLEWDGVLYVRQTGFDYARTGRAFEYFNLVYYSTIAHAVDVGADAVDFGMATYKAKISRGARAQPLWGIAEDREQRQLARRHEFRQWDLQRRQCVADGSAEALERAELP